MIWIVIIFPKKIEYARNLYTFKFSYLFNND